jgi:hypothetical protein
MSARPFGLLVNPNSAGFLPERPRRLLHNVHKGGLAADALSDVLHAVKLTGGIRHRRSIAAVVGAALADAVEGLPALQLAATMC